MEEPNEGHWTSDEDLLGRYVLGQVSRDEHGEMEAHLRLCESCRWAVLKEQRLAAGIRRAGRDELKSQLQNRINDQRISRIPWQYVATAAAVAVIVIGVGIYSRWWVAHDVRQTIPGGEILHEQKGTTENQLEEDKPGKPVTASERESAPASPDDKAGPSTAERKALGLDTGAFSSLTESKDQLKTGVARGSTSAARAAEEGMKSAAKADKRYEGGGLWVEGFVISPEGAAEYAADEFHLRDATERKAKKETADAKGARQLRVTVGATTQDLTLHQQPARVLPTFRQQQALMPQVIQTFVEQRPEGFRMTLYTDSLFDDAALRNAQVRTLGNDSLVLYVARRQIGYRFPSGWLQRQTVNTIR